jgi:hypothetical protein
MEEQQKSLLETGLQDEDSSYKIRVPLFASVDT